MTEKRPRVYLPINDRRRVGGVPRIIQPDRPRGDSGAASSKSAGGALIVEKKAAYDEGHQTGYDTGFEMGYSEGVDVT